MSFSGYAKDYDKLANTDPLKIQILVEDYVLSIKTKVGPNSIPTYVYPIQSFLDSNDIDLKWKKIKRLYPANIKKRGKSAYTTEQVQTLLDVSPDIRSELMIHIMASTGCRIGALFDLKIEHLTILKDGFTAIKFYDDDIEEYTSFLTPEASEVLQRYFNQRRTDGEILTPASPVFRARYRFGKQPVMPMTQRAFEQIVNRALKKSGLRSPDDKKNNRYEIPVNHGFRKRFITILKSIDKIPVAYTERMAGHMVYTDEHNNKIQLDDSYLRPELEKLLSFFKLAVTDLTINQTEKAKQILESQQKKLDELETKNKRIEDLEKRFEKELQNDKEHRLMVDEFFKKIADPNYSMDKDPMFIEMMKPKPQRDMIKDLDEMANRPRDSRFDIDALIKKRNLDN
jgi:integrase